MALQLRNAVHGDTANLLDFWKRAGENTNRFDTAKAVDALIVWDPGALMLVCDHFEIVGSIIAGWDGWRLSLYRYAVDPQRRRQGIGTMLIEAAEERARAVHAARVDAMVLDANSLGRKAWKAAGYVPQEDSTRWVKHLT